MGLTFLPRPPPSRPKKRSRAVADIDGEHSCTQKKKRRLRLFLITSRLSPQFSHPATNIVDRGSSKIAVWAKQKALGRNLLRKAAILNRIRRRAMSARDAEEGQGQVLVEQEREQKQLELARLEFKHGSVDTYTRPIFLRSPSGPSSTAVRTRGHIVVSGSSSSSPTISRSPSPTPPSPPLKGLSEQDPSTYRSPNEAYAYSPPRAQKLRRDYLPSPPSPLGLSNYDALDIEDDIPDPYAHLDDEDEDETPAYPYDDEANDTPFSPSAITTISSTAQTGASQAVETSLPTAYCDFQVLDHGEPVFGDYDDIEDDADTPWPSTPAQEVAAASAPESMSPDFAALLATSISNSPAKRTDSFAMSPTFRPRIPTKSISPNFTPSSLSASTATSPNFTPSTASVSPNFSSQTAPVSVSPNFAPASTSPNFSALDAPETLSVKKKGPGESRPDVLAQKQSDLEQERKRQRDFMFMRFDS